MGVRGPKPKPAGVKAQRAEVRSKRAEPATPAEPIHDAAPPADVAASSPVAAPEWLQGEGLAIWDRLAPRLVQLRLLQGPDVETFARYCRNFARWLKLNRELDQDGETYETVSKHMEGKLKRANPAYLVADRLERMLLATEDRFGLNPAERQRIFQARAQKLPAGAGELPLGEPAQPKRDGESAPAAASAAPSDPDNAVGFLH